MSQILRNGKLFYFCFGSNLWSKRIHINVKSAVKYGNGLLKDWKFMFSSYAELWSGAAANIVPQTNERVCGTVWTIGSEELERLDKQEVGYNRIEIDVTLIDSQESVKCYTYVQKEVKSDNNLTLDKSPQLPSLAYKTVLLKGAIEQQLPEDYIKFLESFETNGILNTGPPNLDL